MGQSTFSSKVRFFARAAMAAMALSGTSLSANGDERNREDAAALAASLNSGAREVAAPSEVSLLRGQPIELAAAVGQVTVNRAADALGRPVYAVRQNFSGSNRMVSFSTRRPVVVRSAGAATLSSVTLPQHLPLASTALTSGFGYRRHPVLGTVRAHSGIDLAAPAGTPVFATSDGMVGTAGWPGGYGLLVELDHGAALQTRYGHLAQVNVVPGQSVRKGEIIGYVGSTGRSTGPHLHYEIRVDQRPINPLGGR